MFCPNCKSEYRADFTHCAPCGVDLVPNPSAGGPAVLAPGSGSEQAPDPAEAMIPYCGFVTLEDARDARDRVRAHGIGSDILIRDTARPSAPAAEEEYWLRVPASAFRNVAQILGYDDEPEAAEGEEEGMLACSDCGKDVSENAAFCPHCGARFDE